MSAAKDCKGKKYNSTRFTGTEDNGCAYFDVIIMQVIFKRTCEQET